MANLFDPDFDKQMARLHDEQDRERLHQMRAERTDRQELISLRISVARVAQALHIGEQVGTLPSLLDLPYTELHELASKRERGWNALCGVMLGRVHELLP